MSCWGGRSPFPQDLALQQPLPSAESEWGAASQQHKQPLSESPCLGIQGSCREDKSRQELVDDRPPGRGPETGMTDKRSDWSSRRQQWLLRAPGLCLAGEAVKSHKLLGSSPCPGGRAMTGRRQRLLSLGTRVPSSHGEAGAQALLGQVPCVRVCRQVHSTLWAHQDGMRWLGRCFPALIFYGSAKSPEWDSVSSVQALSFQLGDFSAPHSPSLRWQSNRYLMWCFKV